MLRDSRITLLHLSDIQFGRNHRFGTKLDSPDEAVDTLLHRLLDDLKQLKKDHGLHPDLLALTGDLAEWGLKSEFDAVLELVVRLSDALKLERSRILLVPGNHDIRDEQPIDDFLSRVETVCRYREKGDVKIARLKQGDPTLEYLRVTVSEGPIARVFPVYGCEGADLPAELERFRRQVVDKYRSSDSGVIAHFVYGGSKGMDSAVQQEAERQRIRLFSFVEYQGLIDFRSYLRTQTARLAADPVYPPGLYVPQRIRYQVGREGKHHDDAYALVRNWLEEPTGRFILILGEFGTGKTFLLRELARSLGGEEGPLTPVLVEMRDLEKGRSLDQLVAQHLAEKLDGVVNLRAFRYMLAQGRILLLFDGFDELATRVSYDRATAHLETLIEAAKGDYAKVVVSSRTQHFESDSQVKTVLGARVETVPRHRIAWLRPFDEPQIRRFLRNRLQDEAAAEQRFELIKEIRDLLGLSHNPRLLGFIADLPEKDLQDARDASGEITAAALYEALLKRWLEGEQARIAPPGTQPLLELEERWEAMGHLAELLWQRTERTVPVSELSAEVQAALEELHPGTLDRDLATHQVGSGTPLVRDEAGNFGFIHQSVMEWLVADRSARMIGQGEDADFLNATEMSPLMADFFRDRCGLDGALAWAQTCLGRAGEGPAKRNALLLLKRLDAAAPTALTLSGQDLRGKDFTGQDLSGANLQGADLGRASLAGAVLQRADLSGASLRGADLTRAHLSAANLTRTDFTAASLLGADLTAAKFDGTDFSHARMLGAKGLETWPADASGFGATPIRLERAGPPPTPLSSTRLQPRSLAFSPDGSLLAVASGNGIRIWSLADEVDVLRLRGHEAEVSGVAFSPDGRTLASASSDKTLRLWDCASGKQTALLRGHKNAVRSVAFSPDGRTLASASSDNSLRLWDCDSGKQTALLRGHENAVSSVAFSPDGRTLASTSSDKTLRLWDCASGKQTALLRGHENAVSSVAFSPDGRTLASASADNSLRLWDCASRRCLAVLMPTPEGWVAWSPDGRYKYEGDITGHFWHAINLCRFEPGELDEWVPGLRMDLDEKFIDIDETT